MVWLVRARPRFLGGAVAGIAPGWAVWMTGLHGPATWPVLAKVGLYFAEAWAQNIGRNNQSYLLDVGKAGVAYLTLGFDQTPHLYSTSAVSIWGGVGSTTLTTPFNFGTNPVTPRWRN